MVANIFEYKELLSVDKLVLIVYESETCWMNSDELGNENQSTGRIAKEHAG